MSRPSSWVWILGVTSLAGLIGAVCASQWVIPPKQPVLHGSPGAQLVAAETALGKLSPGVIRRHMLHLRNTTNENVHISEVSQSCTCTEVSPRSFDIAANSEFPLAVSIKPATERRGATKSILEDFETTLGLRIKGHKAPVEFRLTGQVVHAFSVDPPFVNLRETPRSSADVVVRPIQPFVNVTARCSLDSVDCFIERFGDELFRLRLQGGGGLREGRYPFRITLTATPASGGALEQDVPAELVVEQSLIATPSSVNFALVSLGSMYEETIILQPKDIEDPPTITAVVPNSDDVSVRVDDGDSRARVLRVALRPTATGFFTGNLAVHFNSPTTSEGLMHIRVSWTVQE